MGSRRFMVGVVGTLVVVLSVVARAEASLDVSYQFNGRGHWSLDAVGSNSTPVGIISAIVPLGSAIERAFLYSTKFNTATPAPIVFDGSAYGPAAWTPLGVNVGFLQAWRADVTAQVAAKIGGGGAAPFAFSVDSEADNFGTDGELLAIVYSNPAELERTIAFLDGFSASGGDMTDFNFSEPVDIDQPGFEALMSLGIGFGFQSSGQFSQVNIDGRRLTTSAGGQDDGFGANGALITAGGIGDSPVNPVDPFVTDCCGPRTDDELYNLALGNGVSAAGFIPDGATSFHVDTLNPSHDDNIFFLGLNVTARGGVNAPPPPPDDQLPPGPVIPEPATMLLMGAGLAGVAATRRRRA